VGGAATSAGAKSNSLQPDSIFSRKAARSSELLLLPEARFAERAQPSVQTALTEQAQFPRPRDGLGAVAYEELAKDVVDVRFDRAH
jgi:hypothetical protein